MAWRKALLGWSAISLFAASCAGDERERAPSSNERFATAGQALTFNSNPYAFVLPPLDGTSYPDVVPKTLDLSDMAALTLRTMTLNADPNANYKFWFQTDWQHRPSRLHHEGEFRPPDFDGDLESQGKFIGPLVWNRLASGSSFNTLNHRRILDQLFLDVNQTYGLGGSGTRAFEGFIANYLRDGNALWKTFVLQAAQNWTEQLEDPDGSGETGFWPNENEPPTDHHAQDPWREEVLLLAYKQLGYAPALQAVRRHVAFTIRHAQQFDEEGRFMDNHEDLDSDVNQVFGAHFHVHGLYLQNFLDLGLLVQDQGLIDFVRRSYEWAKLPEVGSADVIGYFPELVERPENGEACSTMDMVKLAIDMSRHGVADYWDDADRWIRNHFAEELLTPEQGARLRAFSDREGDDSVPLEPIVDSTEQVTERSIGSFAGWPSPNEYRHPDRPGIQQCCTGNGARAVFHVWENMISEEDGILKIHLLLNRATPRADVYSHVPYVGKVEVEIKKTTDGVHLRIPGWVSSSGLKLAVNGASRPLNMEGRYARVGRVFPGDRITVTFTMSESTQSQVIAGTRYTFTRRGSTVVSVTPRGRIAPLYNRSFYRSSPAPMVSVTRFLAEDADLRARKDPTWELPVVDVTASRSEEDFSPEEMLDGDQADHSRWSARGIGQFAVFDLGRRYSVKYVNAAFYRGEDRIQRFEVQVSPDGRPHTYRRVFVGQSGGRTTSLTAFNLESAPLARFVKLIGLGNTENHFNDFTEFEIFGTTSDTPSTLDAEVSASEQDGSNGPERVQDGRFDTRWQADETQFLQFDLGSTKSVASLDLAFYRATSLTYRFDIEVSTNGDDFTLARTGRSSDDTLGFQSFDIPNLAARYVRIVGQGNSVDGSIAITEARVRGF